MCRFDPAPYNMEAMINTKMRLALVFMVAALMAACSSTRQSAPIVDRTSRVDARNGVTAVSTAPRQMDSQGNYMVRKGDTLFQISQEFGQSFRDLVAWNNLENANDIRVDQLLRVIPPVAAVNGTQSVSVASGSGIEVRPLTAPAIAESAPNKIGPRGDKQPYADSTLAEMQKPEGLVSAPATVQSTAKVVEKPAQPQTAANSEDAGVAWIWPAEGKIVGTFDEGKKGIDIGGKSGQPIVAAGAGKVMYAGGGIRGYGNLVIVKHTNNLLSAYAHNKTILVKEGQSVDKGEKIAEMGNTDADAVKLHFEIRQQGKPVDPSKFLPSR